MRFKKFIKNHIVRMWSKFDPSGRELLQWTALCVAIVAAGFSLLQLVDTKRTLSMNSLLIIKENYSVPKLEFFGRILAREARLESKNTSQDSATDFYEESIAYFYGIEYLRSIESVCNAYLRGLLGSEAEQFVESYIRTDIENLLLYFVEDDGTIEIGDTFKIEWMVEKRDESDNGQRDVFGNFGGYPSTRECIELWEIHVRKKTIF